jgi:hypothetical protein
MNNSRLLSQLKQYAPRTHWIYTSESLNHYAFEAGLPIPPEIAVVSLKRFWSGQISVDKTINTCMRYRPEQVLLDTNTLSSQWIQFVQNHTAVYEEGNTILYVDTAKFQ